MKRQLATAALVAAVSTVVIPGLASADPTVAVDGYSFRVLDEKSVSGVDNISGIDYHDGSFVAISDDRSRVYTDDLALTDDGFGRPSFRSTTLREADGTGFPQGGEAVRVDPADGSLVWANPGRHTRRTNLDSTVQRSAADGTFVAQYPAAPHTAANIQDNGGVAGLTFNTTGTFVISALAKPLAQDGSTTVRLSFASRTTGTVLSQLAYDLDPGQSLEEIEAVDATHYLVLERGRHSVRLYEATTAGARSVLPFESVVGATYTPVTKRLLVDFADLGLRGVDLAGMTWGPTLTSGERTLVLASDNNCDGRTKLVALAVTLS